MRKNLLGSLGNVGVLNMERPVENSLLGFLSLFDADTRDINLLKVLILLIRLEGPILFRFRFSETYEYLSSIIIIII